MHSIKCLFDSNLLVRYCYGYRRPLTTLRSWVPLDRVFLASRRHWIVQKPHTGSWWISPIHPNSEMWHVNTAALSLPPNFHLLVVSEGQLPLGNSVKPEEHWAQLGVGYNQCGNPLYPWFCIATSWRWASWGKPLLETTLLGHVPMVLLKLRNWWGRYI